MTTTVRGALLATIGLGVGDAIAMILDRNVTTPRLVDDVIELVNAALVRAVDYGAEHAARDLGERTGDRHMALSLRKRGWLHFPCVDVDDLMIEYDLAHPTAIVEYKHVTAAPVDVETNTNIRALINLGDAAGLPVVLCIFDEQDWTRWIVRPLNAIAKDLIKTGDAESVIWTEGRVITFLSDLRWVDRTWRR